MYTTYTETPGHPNEVGQKNFVKFAGGMAAVLISAALLLALIRALFK